MHPPHARWALLRHDTPDGAWHCDWVLERPRDPREHRLITFRLDTPPKFAPAERFDATRIPDHRAAYLDHEGPVPGDRGHVRRLLQGTLLWLLEAPDLAQAACEIGGTVRLIIGRPAASAPSPDHTPPLQLWNFQVRG